MELSRAAATATTAATDLLHLAKSGDEGNSWMKFIEGKNCVSWSESERTMPAKQGAGFSYDWGRAARSRQCSILGQKASVRVHLIATGSAHRV